MGSNASNRNGTRVPCIGSAESKPLDFQKSPSVYFTTEVKLLTACVALWYLTLLYDLMPFYLPLIRRLQTLWPSCSFYVSPFLLQMLPTNNSPPPPHPPWRWSDAHPSSWQTLGLHPNLWVSVYICPQRDFPWSHSPNNPTPTQ